MKRILCLLSLCALALGASQAFADKARVFENWKTVPVTFRTLTNATTGSPQDVARGYIDSTTIFNGGLADLDTSTVIDLRDQYVPRVTGAFADSLQFIWVEVQGANAFASGESLYVTFDAMNSQGGLIANLGLASCPLCGPGGYHAAGTLVPGTTSTASREFNGAGSATAGIMAQASSPAGTGRPVILYGNFGGFPFLRLRVHSDYAVVPVSNLIKFFVHYLSTETPPSMSN